MKHYSQKTKRRGAQADDATENAPVPMLAEDTGISKVTLYDWRKHAIAKGLVAVWSIHRRIGVLRKTGHLIPRTRPGRFRVLEYTSLGFDVWLIVQGTRWNKDLLGIANFPWQGPSALGAESAPHRQDPFRVYSIMDRFLYQKAW